MSEHFYAWLAEVQAQMSVRPVVANPLDESKEQLGPVDVGTDPNFWHWRCGGTRLCGEPASMKSITEEEKAARPERPDCKRLHRKTL